MLKVMIIGSPGAGKSTFARKLRDMTGLPLYYLDLLWHKPDRTNISGEEFDRKLDEIVRKDKWIIDGNYQRTLETRLKECDTVFLLDYPLETCLAGAESRIGEKREDLPWTEQELDEAFRQWIIDFPQTQLPRIYELLEEYRGEKEIVIFKTRQEENAYLKRNMFYRLAEESDIEAICGLIKAAVSNMEEQQIFQWDDIYPAKEDFLDDIHKQQLYIGLLDGEAAVVYTVNKESDREYENGKWNYPDCEYRIIHRLCVNPAYQNRGIAKSTLAHIEQELRKSNIEAVRLDAFSENPFALSLYFNAGYEKVGFADWRKGRFYLMEKRL